MPLTRELNTGTRDRLLYELARDLSSSLELDVVLRRSMDRVITLMRASRGCIVLIDPENGDLSVEASCGDSNGAQASRFFGSRTVIEHVVQTKAAVITTDASHDMRFKKHDSVIGQGLRSIIAVPLVTKGRLIGAVYADSPHQISVFEDEDKVLLQAIADIIAIAIDNARQYERSEFLRQLFERYVNKQVTEYVLARSDPNTIFFPGQRRLVTILNSDIAGFSRLSATMGSVSLVAFLNEYLRRMIEVVLAHGGNIDKFQGDGMLVVFGAPNPMQNHAAQALSAARAMVKEIHRLNEELMVVGRPRISVGIGIDTGEVVAGHVGSERRLEFTLIGMPVNNATNLSKVRPARVLISEATRALLPTGLDLAGSQPVRLRGAKVPGPIFELAGQARAQ